MKYILTLCLMACGCATQSTPVYPNYELRKIGTLTSSEGFKQDLFETEINGTPYFVTEGAHGRLHISRK